MEKTKNSKFLKVLDILLSGNEKTKEMCIKYPKLSILFDKLTTLSGNKGYTLEFLCRCPTCTYVL